MKLDAQQFAREWLTLVGCVVMSMALNVADVLPATLILFAIVVGIRITSWSFRTLFTMTGIWRTLVKLIPSPRICLLVSWLLMLWLLT